MPANKNQHYVPQFYMKLFADKHGKFNIFNIKSRKKYVDVPYKNQCQKDYFYGKDLALENKFRDMETEWSIVFDKIIKEDGLSDKDIKTIKQFAVYQSTRTVAAFEHTEEFRRIQMTEYIKMGCENKGLPITTQQIQSFVEKELKKKRDDIPFSLSYSEECLSYMNDLNVVIVTYDTTEPLISSDVPIVNVNKFLESHVGYALAGFLSFFPVCSNKIVAIYDARMYSRYRNELYVKSNDENEVRTLNEYQLINAENIIFGSCLDMDDFYTADVQEVRNNNRNRPPVQIFGPNNNKLLAFTPRLSIYSSILSFAALNHDARRVPIIGRDFLPRIKSEKYIERMDIRENIIPNIDKMHSDRSIENRKEYRRSIRKMNQFVYRYWGKPIPIQVLNHK